MNNLLERLKPEYLEKFNATNLDYTHQLLEESLSKKLSWGKMTIEEFEMLTGILEIPFNISYLPIIFNDL